MNRAMVAAPLSSAKTRRTEWIYADRIPLRTGTILAGQGGIAKSTILSDIIARATRGELPGTFYGTPVRVGMISPEDDIESILVPRLVAARADLQYVETLHVAAEQDGRVWTTLPNLADDLTALGETIRARGIKLLIVDPLVSIMSGNSISQSDVRRNFDPLSALAKDADFAVLAVAHFGKSGDRAGDRLSGSHAFRDIARVVIVAAVDEETGLRVLTVEKSNYSPLQPSDAYRVESVPVRLDDGYTQDIGRASLVGASAVTVQDILDRDRDHSTLSDLSQRIVEQVETHPDGVKAETVAAALREDVAKVRKYLGRAADRGDIQRRERGVFVPLSRGVSVPSGSNATQITHIGHIPYRDTSTETATEVCPRCGEPSPEANASHGYLHPTCVPVEVAG